jgi:hypothetical protein
MFYEPFPDERTKTVRCGRGFREAVAVLELVQGASGAATGWHIGRVKRGHVVGAVSVGHTSKVDTIGLEIPGD